MTSPTPPLDPIAQAWVDHMRIEHTPPNTLKARLRVLRSIGDPGTASRDDIETWWRTRTDLAPATRSNDLACLRAFYRWAQRWEHRTDDPTTRLDAPKVSNGIPRPISRADLHKVLTGVDDDMRRAVCLGAYAGLRVSEVAALSWDHVDLERRRADITGKGGKLRVVALSAVLVDQLLPVTAGTNVVTATPRGYTAGVLERKVNRAIARAGVDATFHQLRHRYGTIGYQATRDIVAVGRQMGHSSPVTTAIYAQASDDVADAIAEAVSR